MRQKEVEAKEETVYESVFIHLKVKHHKGNLRTRKHKNRQGQGEHFQSLWRHKF